MKWNWMEDFILKFLIDFNVFWMVYRRRKWFELFLLAEKVAKQEIPQKLLDWSWVRIKVVKQSDWTGFLVYFATDANATINSLPCWMDPVHWDFQMPRSTFLRNAAPFYFLQWRIQSVGCVGIGNWEAKWTRFTSSRWRLWWVLNSWFFYLFLF